MTYKYTFFGKVFPERTNVDIPLLNLVIKNEEAKLDGLLIVSIHLSQITALFSSEYKIENVFTLKNIIEDGIRLEVDILGYLLGCGYDIEITSMVDSDFNENVIFGVGENILIAQQHIRPKNFEEVLNLFNDSKGDYLRRCFSDMREAIRTAKDTGFFCYRAIESLRQYYVIEKECLGDKNSWEELRKSLKVEIDDINYIKSFANNVRHGGSKYISGEERSKVLSLTWEIVDKYILFASNGYK